LNIGSLIGILGLATFICDIVALYVHRQSDVYRQQKFQDVDLNLLRLETLNTLPLNMMSDEAKFKHANHVEEAIRTGHIIDSANDKLSHIESPHKEKFQRNKSLPHELYDDLSLTSKDTNQQSTPMLIYGNYHQQKIGLTNSLGNTPTSIKQRRNIQPTQAAFHLSNNDKERAHEKTNMIFADEDDTQDLNDTTEEEQLQLTENNDTHPNHKHLNSIQPKIETFL